MSEAGVSDNLIERIRYRKWRGQGRYAPCRFLNEKERGSILVMEYVEPIGWGMPNTPDWAKYIDCGQVGTSRHGSVLAYDYGD